MKKMIYFILLILVVLSGCVSYQSITSQVSITDLSTDKNLYHSAESMKIKVIIDTNSDLDNVTVRLNGIKGRLNQEKNIHLGKGSNQVDFSYKLPRCNVCGGIREGDYEIKGIVGYENLVVNASTWVKIRQ